MKLVDYKKPDQMKDFTVPFYWGNFLHCSSSIAKELMAEAAIVLKELMECRGTAGRNGKAV